MTVDASDYKLEEMKQLRTLIVTLVREIIKLEIFAVTSLAALIYFNLQYTGQSWYVEWGLRLVPACLAVLILFKAVSFANRIRLIDTYLMTLEEKFVKDGWVKFFYGKNHPWLIMIERVAISGVIFLISVGLAFVPPSQLRSHPTGKAPAVTNESQSAQPRVT
jgi:hypothetical protein